MLGVDSDIVGSHLYCVCKLGAERYIKKVLIYLEKYVLGRKISCGDRSGQIANRELESRIRTISSKLV